MGFSFEDLSSAPDISDIKGCPSRDTRPSQLVPAEGTGGARASYLVSHSKHSLLENSVCYLFISYILAYFCINFKKKKSVE